MPRGSIESKPWRGIDVKQSSILCTAFIVCIAGCSLTRTHYTRPPLDTPKQWQQVKQATTDSEAGSITAGGHWWRRFQDPSLNALVEEALRRNADLAAATIRVRQAQLQAQLAKNQLFPTVDAQVSFNETRTLYTPTYTTRSAGTSLAASYEVDLWGRLASLSAAAQWEARATEQDRESTALTLVGTLMRLYWQSAYLNQLIRSNQASIGYAQQTLALIQSQYRAGAVTELEVVQARQNLETQQADRAQLLDQQSQTATSLALLFDAPPESTRTVTLQSLSDVVLPDIEPGLPAEILSHRPDVHAAELRLRASLANVDATRAGFYPTFTLTGSLGTVSTRLAEVLKNPVGTLGAGLTLPFIQWRDAKYTIGISRAEYEQAVVSFRQTFYRALSDVENALSTRLHLAERDEFLTRNLNDARTAEHLNEVRYKAGAVALTAWLDAQEARRAAENAWALNRLNQLTTQVALYQALGEL